MQYSAHKTLVLSAQDSTRLAKLRLRLFTGGACGGWPFFTLLLATTLPYRDTDQHNCDNSLKLTFKLGTCPPQIVPKHPAPKPVLDQFEKTPRRAPFRKGRRVREIMSRPVRSAPPSNLGIHHSSCRCVADTLSSSYLIICSSNLQLQ